LTRAVDRRGHPAIDRRLHDQGIGPGLLDTQLDPQKVAQDVALSRLAQMKYCRLLIRHLRQRRARD
jgi:hypothetical protein